jgi:hypothetical protein
VVGQRRWASGTEAAPGAPLTRALRAPANERDVDLPHGHRTATIEPMVEVRVRFLLVLALGAPSIALAQVYKCPGVAGQVVLQQAPCSGEGGSMLLTPAYTTPHAKPAAAADERSKPQDARDPRGPQGEARERPARAG